MSGIVVFYMHYLNCSSCNTIFISVLHMRTLRLGHTSKLAQDHTSSKYESWYSIPGPADSRVQDIKHEGCGIILALK
jgi:hypothetical protein